MEQTKQNTLKTVSILTAAPWELESFRKTAMLQHVEREGLVKLEIVDIRDFVQGSFRKIDDSPYGGGPGLILRCEPVFEALRITKKKHDSKKARVIILAPIGKTYTQKDAHRLGEYEHLILICGHYEGLDARIYDLADEIISIGDYILTGGELAAQVVADSVIRLLPESLKGDSAKEESFEQGLLEYPQYTRPAEFEGRRVPEVLLSGDHFRIRKWREEKAREWTGKYRPDLLCEEQVGKTEISQNSETNDVLNSQKAVNQKN